MYVADAPRRCEIVCDAERWHHEAFVRVRPEDPAADADPRESHDGVEARRNEWFAAASRGLQGVSSMAKWSQTHCIWPRGLEVRPQL